MQAKVLVAVVMAAVSSTAVASAKIESSKLPWADWFDEETPEPAGVTPHSMASCVVDSPALAQCVPGVVAIGDGVPHVSIEAAFSSSSDIAVCPGTHEVQLTTRRDVTLRSASGNPADTVLTGNGAHRIVESGGNLVVAGLTLRNGYHDYSGGAIESHDLVVRCSSFQNNRSDYEGGAVSVSGALQVQDVSFIGNEAGYEGGAINFGSRADSTLEVTNSVFKENFADYSGGAIEIGSWARNDRILLSNSRFVDNRDGHDDGVVSFGSWGGFTATVDGCEFSGNDVAMGLNGPLKGKRKLDVTANNTFVGPRGNW